MKPALLQGKIGVRSMNNVLTALTAGMDSTADSSVFKQSWWRSAGNRSTLMTVSCPLLLNVV